MKKWLITGASSGFGRLLAERVATNGDHVIAVARREDRLRELAADHDSVTPLVVDLTVPAAEQSLGKAIDAVGGLDILVNNAGYGLFSSVEQTPDSEARAVFDTNLFAPLAVLRAALPSLRKNRGRVLQLSSMLGEVAWLGSGVYSASKAQSSSQWRDSPLSLLLSGDRKSTRLNSSHTSVSRMPSSA